MGKKFLLSQSVISSNCFGNYESSKSYCKENKEAVKSFAKTVSHFWIKKNEKKKTIETSEAKLLKKK